MSTKQIKIGHKKARRVDNDGKLVEFDEFQVISAKNSTDYLPGQELTRAGVDELCRSSAWEVTIVALNEGGGR